jgi:AbrB family transcriptional regulator (stage V sporulation protein T)
MKATGIVRRIDDLGRVVIPKEIRRTMRIREGDPLEIFTDADGEVVFKKYSPVGEMSTIAKQYAEVLFRGTNCPILVTDADRVVACAGLAKKEIVDRRITPALESVIESRNLFVTGEGEHLIPVEGVEREAIAAVPIIGFGDSSGSVVLLQGENGAGATTIDVKLIQITSSFLSKQIDS